MTDLTDEENQYVINRLLTAFAGIANKEYQKRIWIRGEGPECDDFDETACELSELSDSILEEYKKYYVTDEQYLLLKIFMDKFNAFCMDNDYPEEFIDTSEWDNITKMAQEILAAFNYPGNSTPSWA